jgi:hypothetical protein
LLTFSFKSNRIALGSGTYWDRLENRSLGGISVRRQLQFLLAFALQLALLLPAGSARREAPGVPPKLDNPRNFTLLGFVAGQTKFSALEQALDAVRSSKFSGLICIVAATPDHTRITFFPSEFDDTLDGIQVTAGSIELKWESICQQSPMATATMATAGGLRLGLSKDAVVARYGEARSRDDVGQLFGYESYRSLTEIELKTACEKRANPEKCSSEDYEFVADIQLTFHGGKLISFELTRGIST